MALKNTVHAIPMITFDTSTIAVGYQIVNPNGLPNACFILRLFNTSNVDIIISYDGVTNHDLIAANSVNIYSVQNNAQPSNYVCKFAAGTRIWIKQLTGAAAGTFAIIGYYQD